MSERVRVEKHGVYFAVFLNGMNLMTETSPVKAHSGANLVHEALAAAEERGRLRGLEQARDLACHGCDSEFDTESRVIYEGAAPDWMHRNPSWCCEDDSGDEWFLCHANDIRDAIAALRGQK